MVMAPVELWIASVASVSAGRHHSPTPHNEAVPARHCSPSIGGSSAVPLTGAAFWGSSAVAVPGAVPLIFAPVCSPLPSVPVGRVVDLVCAEQPAHAVGQLALADTVGLGLRLLGKARGRVAIGVDLVADGATLFIPAVKQSQEQVVYPLL